MSTLLRKVPVVTYTLLERVEAQKRQRKIAESYRAAAKEYEAALLKTKLENEKRLAEKRAIREEIERTHVIPPLVLEEKREKKEAQKKVREFALVEQYRQKRLAEDILRAQKEHTFRMKRFRKEMRLARVVPIEIKRLPVMFDESVIGKAELLECEKPLVSVLANFARVVGFDVELDEWEDKTAVILWKPYPYWRYAFSGEKKNVVPKR